MMIEQELWGENNSRAERASEQSHWSLRLLRWLARSFQPALGWGTLALSGLLLNMLVYTLVQSRWLADGSPSYRLVAVALLATVVSWWCYGWRRDRRLVHWRSLRIILLLLGNLFLGVVVVSQMVAGWLPGITLLIATLRNGDWPNLATQSAAGIERLLARLVLWWQTLQAGDPVRDELILLLIAGALVWLMAGVTTLLLRRFQRGLLASAPIVALAVALLFWGREDRSAILLVLVCALLLHLWLHQRVMQRQWAIKHLDYSPQLILDRLFAVLAVGLVVVLLAAFLPNLYIRSLALWYWQLMSPANQQINEFRQQILPDLLPSTRWREGVGTGGLPNEFLLGAGPEELGNMLVMYVRTNEAVEEGYDQVPEGHYLRGLTLAEYDGKGWRNPSELERSSLPADQRWLQGDLEGRRLLAQSVEVHVDSPMLFASGEAIEASVDSAVEELPGLNLVGLRSWQQRYTVLSAIPAVGEQRLIAAGDWNDVQPLPADMQLFLQLPPSVPPRVPELAQQLTLTTTTLFAKAAALESYLRQFPYDLAVPELPANVTDVADYFLFDLQRGYCDYYATAFVVLARSIGIPARMATGYAVGYWNATEMQWTITEAQAHSWPEVYFPQYGWIPFEPTAARPSLSRIDLAPSLPQAQGAPAVTLLANDESEGRWNWQMLFWLLPIILLLWLGGSWLRRRLGAQGDPWQTLLRWGARRGQPMTDGDTILEYGETLSSLFVAQSERTANPDGLRGASREVTVISQAVSESRYAEAQARSSAMATIAAHWQRIRAYVR